MNTPFRGNQSAPGKLWSLWEMLEVKALPFVKATDLITQIRIYRNDPNVTELDSDARAFLLTVLGDLKEQLLALEASRPTMASVEKILALLNGDDWSWPRLGLHMEELRGRLFDDLGGEFLLSLNEHERHLFEDVSPWGDLVSRQFPGLQDEAREASKCLALGRYTASAFHSLRCLEGGILALSRCLQIPDPTKGHERNWSAMLRKIDEARKARWNAAALMNGDGQIFDELYGALAGMQNPWRNATMHLENSLNKEQARHVFDVAGGFMRRVAERMDENGLPFA